MTQKLKISSSIGFSLIFLFLFFNQKFKGNPKLNLQEDIIQNGDLIFRRGRSAESHAVILSDRNSHFSHVGIIYMENEIPYVIHAVPGENKKAPAFLKKEKIDEFLTSRKAKDFAVYRSDFTEKEKKAAAEEAFKLYKKHIIFDTDYNLNTDDKLYCTELIMKAYQEAMHKSLNLATTHLNFIFGSVNVVMPGNLIENPHFNPISNN